MSRDPEQTNWPDLIAGAIAWTVIAVLTLAALASVAALAWSALTQ